MREFRFVVISIASSVLAQALCLAKLDVVSLEELLKNSSLIVLAHSTEAMQDHSGRGHANLQIEQIVRGSYPRSTIRIEWFGREDDHGIREVGREYLLFLRKGSDGYDAAIHGVSYWPVTYTLDAKRAVEHSYPTTMIDVPRQLISRVDPPPDGIDGRVGRCPVEVILVERLIQWVSARSSEPANIRLKLAARGRSAAAWSPISRAAA